jgi:predicted amidophosphoribosyltransferase
MSKGKQNIVDDILTNYQKKDPVKVPCSDLDIYSECSRCGVSTNKNRERCSNCMDELRRNSWLSNSKRRRKP